MQNSKGSKVYTVNRNTSSLIPNSPSPVVTSIYSSLYLLPGIATHLQHVYIYLHIDTHVYRCIYTRTFRLSPPFPLQCPNVST